MTIEEYEFKFCDELVDNWTGKPPWHVYVNRCYQAYLDSLDEQRVEMKENVL